MQIGVIQFPGSNCERETSLAIQRAGMVPHDFLWNQDPALLQGMAGFVIVGGFSYEDRSRAGIIAALDPIMQVIRAQSELGKPILGICNGAQILVEAGLVPGIEHHQVGLALTENKRIQQGKILGTGYYNEWVYMRLCDQYQRNAFTRHLNSDVVLRVPVAHAEGRFMITPALSLELVAQGLGLFQYCDAKGTISSEFPVNPNGSHANLAGISNKRGNVLALMPHPERTFAGDPLFRSMRDYIKEGYAETLKPMHYYPRFSTPLTNPYRQTAGRLRYLVASIVTDNAAMTLQSTLARLGFQATIKRYVHWELDEANGFSEAALQESGVLFNPRKEYLIHHSLATGPNTKCFLVRSKENIQGQACAQLLRDHFSLNVPHLQHGILWEVTVQAGDPPAVFDSILATHIFHNPYAYDCYHYATA